VAPKILKKAGTIGEELQDKRHFLNNWIRLTRLKTGSWVEFSAGKTAPASVAKLSAIIEEA